MVNRKITLGLLALVGGLTIVGSGFSAWYFGDGVESKTQNVNAHITPLAEKFGTITTTDLAGAGVSLQLDQGGIKNKADLDKGISFIDGYEETYNTTINGTYSIISDNSVNAMNAGLKAKFKCVVTLKKAYAEYIEFKDSFYDQPFTRATDGEGNTIVEVSKDVEFKRSDVSSQINFNIATDSTTLINSAFKYKTGKKPQDKAELATLQTLNVKDNNALSFVYSLEILTK